jgi:hypothetical protein
MHESSIPATIISIIRSLRDTRLARSALLPRRTLRSTGRLPLPSLASSRRRRASTLATRRISASKSNVVFVFRRQLGFAVDRHDFDELLAEDVLLLQVRSRGHVASDGADVVVRKSWSVGSAGWRFAVFFGGAFRVAGNFLQVPDAENVSARFRDDEQDLG